MTRDGVIGKNGQIPWQHKGDLKRFKDMTSGNIIIMGRLTWESLGQKALPNRLNIVVSERWALDGAGALHARSFLGALNLAHTAQASEPNKEIFFCGGAVLYKAALEVARFLDITIVPDVIPTGPGFDGELTIFPPVNIGAWRPEYQFRHPHPLNPDLELHRFVRRVD